MSLAQAAWKVEQAVGHGENATTAQDVTNPGLDRERFGDSSERMKALVWTGKNSVEIIDCPKPKVLEDRDVIVKVTGSTVCGSDLHLIQPPIASSANPPSTIFDAVGQCQSRSVDRYGLFIVSDASLASRQAYRVSL